MSEDVERTRARLEEDPGAAEFPALAELLRRAGRLEEAAMVAARGLDRAPENLAGRLLLGLIRLERGEHEAARRDLCSALEVVLPEESLVGLEAAEEAPEPESQQFDDTIRDDEIDSAFQNAASDPEQMVDANDLAAEAMRRESLDVPEVPFTPSEHPDFATNTMAELLEEQGDDAGAAVLRATLEGRAAAAPMQSPAAPIRRVQLETLEHWLANLQRNRSARRGTA